MHFSRAIWFVGPAIIAAMAGVHAAQSAPRRPAPTPMANAAAQTAPSTTVAQVPPAVDRALLDRYCIGCHNERTKTAGLMLDKVDITKVSANAETLEKVVWKLRTGQMPPAGSRRPEQPAIDAFATSLEAALDRAAAGSPNPGRLPIRRLNRVEYVSVIRDLLDLEIDGSALLPPDNSGLGFDNNAEVLSVTPALMARYISAATKVSRLAIGSPTIRPVTQVYAASQFGRQSSRMGEDLPFGTHGGLAVRHAFPLDGDYTFRIRLQRNTVGGTIRGIDEAHEIEARIDRALVRRFTIGGQYKGADSGILIAIPENEVEMQKLHTYRLEADKDLEFKIPVKAGTRIVGVAFSDSSPAMSEAVPVRSRSIKAAVFSDDAGDPGVDTIEISGPENATVPASTPSRERILVCRPAGVGEEEPCARRILQTLTRRAYRRPVTDADVRPLMKIYESGRSAGSFETAIERALEAMLASPAFLFRIERDPAGAAPGTVYRLSDLELASRLSFFLWKSIPDDVLLDAAVKGTLKDPVVLSAQVKRMLADRRSTRWTNDFVGQWLLIRNIQQFDPDPGLFPDFDDTLRDALIKETELFFESQVRDDRSVLDLLQADYTYLNDRLAEHYGLRGVYGSHFRRVPVTDPLRRGLLGQASVLSVTSYPNRTSVVLRGKWVLENLLGAPPPPPPPDVPPLKENDGRSRPTSLRDRMQEHRASATCSACHAHIDPMGFALENFDATGRWRDQDAGAPIDASSVLIDGTKIESPQMFRTVLRQHGNRVVQTLTEKLFTYAIGRGVEYYDQPAIRHIVQALPRDGQRWSSLVLAIVNSQAFQMRRVADASAPEPAPTSVAQGR
jgi:hypothetical protein